MRKAPVQHEKYVVKVLEKAMKILDVYSRIENAFTLDDLTKILDEVHSVVAAINRGEGTIGRLVYDSKFYDALLDLLDRIKLTIDDYRQMATSIEEKGLKVR